MHFIFILYVILSCSKVGNCRLSGSDNRTKFQLLGSDYQKGIFSGSDFWTGWEQRTYLCIKEGELTV